MRTVFAVAAMVMVFGSCAFAENETNSAAATTNATTLKTMFDLSAAGSMTVPGDKDFYSSVSGADIRADYWILPEFGIGIHGGFASAKVDSSESESYVTWDLFRVRSTRTLSGNVRLIPIGFLTSYRLYHVKETGLSLQFDAGIDYVKADSSAKVSVNVNVADLIYGDQLDGTATGDLSVGNGVLGKLGVTADYDIAENVGIICSIGYALDIQKGSVSVDNSRMQIDGRNVDASDLDARQIEEESKLGGFTVSLGARYSF